MLNTNPTSKRAIFTPTWSCNQLHIKPVTVPAKPDGLVWCEIGPGIAKQGQESGVLAVA